VSGMVSNGRQRSPGKRFRPLFHRSLVRFSIRFSGVGTVSAPGCSGCRFPAGFRGFLPSVNCAGIEWTQ
jgi:hypothetical protein